MIDLADFGRRIAHRRRDQLELTRAELAALLHRSESWVLLVESGEQAIDRRAIGDLALALDVSVIDLAPDLVPGDLEPASTAPYHDDAILTLRQAAELLSSTPPAMKKWIRAGQFCPVIALPNGELRVRYGDLMDWVLSLRSTPEP